MRMRHTTKTSERFAVWITDIYPGAAAKCDLCNIVLNAREIVGLVLDREGVR